MSIEEEGQILAGLRSLLQDGDWLVNLRYGEAFEIRVLETGIERAKYRAGARLHPDYFWDSPFKFVRIPKEAMENLIASCS